MELNKAFEDILMDFFFKYDKKYRRKVKKIVQQFDGREKEVLLNLCAKYKVSPANIEGITLTEEEKEKFAHYEAAKSKKTTIEDKYKNVAPGAESPDEGESEDDVHSYDTAGSEELNDDGKKKKMLLIIIIAIVLLGGGGTGAYLFMSSDSSGSETEVVETGEVIENDPATTTVDSTQAADSTQASDSTQAVDSLSSDSAAIDSTQAAEDTTDGTAEGEDQQTEE